MRGTDRQVAEHVRTYLDMGWSVVPLNPQSKAPTSADWQTRQIGRDDVDQHFNADSNVGVNLGEMSGGLLDIDLEDFEVIEAAKILLPTTERVSGRAQMRSNHWYYLVRECIRRVLFNDPLDGMLLLEIRGDGCQTMIAPSVHPEGDTLEWESEGAPAEVEFALLRRACGKVAVTAFFARHWSLWPTQHHSLVMHLSGGLFRAGWTLEEVEELVGAIADTSGDHEPKDRIEAVRSTHKRWENKDEITGWPSLIEVLDAPVVKKLLDWLGVEDSRRAHFQMTDDGNAQRLAKHFGDILRYVPEWGQWIVWNGRRWKIDNSGEIMSYVRQTLDRMWEEAAQQNDPEIREKMSKWILNSQSINRMKAMHQLAQSIQSMVVHADELDRNQLQLNTVNGTYDIETGALLPHDKNGYHTKMTNVRFNPEAKCPRFLEYFERIQPDPQVRAFLQRALGYSMTGSNEEQVFFIAYGNTANGKSTLIKLMGYMLCDYAVNADVTTFLHTGSDKIRTDLARMAGSRFVGCTEPDEGQRLAVSLIKKITGGDSIVSRKLYQAEFEHYASYKIWISTNHRPKASSSDDALWRRVQMIPFNVTIPKEEQNKRLTEELFDTEKEGILLWLLEGARLWKRDGLGSVEAVEQATHDYREHSDSVALFIDSECELDEKAEVGSGSLYAAYKDWCNDSNEKAVSSNVFKEKLTRLGLEVKRKEKGMVWVGLRLPHGASALPTIGAPVTGVFGRPSVAPATEDESVGSM